jgi:hypothetical protein
VNAKSFVCSNSDCAGTVVAGSDNDVQAARIIVNTNIAKKIKVFFGNDFPFMRGRSGNRFISIYVLQRHRMQNRAQREMLVR